MRRDRGGRCVQQQPSRYGIRRLVEPKTDAGADVREHERRERRRDPADGRERAGERQRMAARERRSARRHRERQQRADVLLRGQRRDHEGVRRRDRRERQRGVHRVGRRPVRQPGADEQDRAVPARSRADRQQPGPGVGPAVVPAGGERLPARRPRRRSGLRQLPHQRSVAGVRARRLPRPARPEAARGVVHDGGPDGERRPTGACALGGASCHDGEGLARAARRRPRTARRPRRAATRSMRSRTWCSAGLASGSAAPPVTVLRCTFRGTAGSDSFTPCTGSDGNAEAVTSGNFGGVMASCQAPLLDSPSDGWGKSVELGSSSGSDSNVGVSLRVDLATPCKLTLTLKPDSSDSFSLPPTVDEGGAYELGALLTTGVAIPASSGGGSGSASAVRGVAIPLVIRLQPGGCSRPRPGRARSWPGAGAGWLRLRRRPIARQPA